MFMLSSFHKQTERRLNIAIGQVKGLKKMIDEDKYCMDILTQSLAIQKSLSSLSKLVIENHISEHVIPMLSSNDAEVQQKAADELLKIYEIHNRRSKQ